MILQHYTTIENAKQIIENKSLHLTDFRFTNDSEELAYGWSVLFPLFKIAVKSLNLDGDLKAEYESKIKSILQTLNVTKTCYYTLKFYA